jgi:hypothetical protein
MQCCTGLSHFLHHCFRGRPLSNIIAEPTIYDLAYQCLKAFKRLRLTLEQPGPLYSKLISLPAVDDENGRFRGWTSNIGALKTDRSSLDFRLRDVTFLFDNVITLLDSLQASLLEGLEILQLDSKFDD